MQCLASSRPISPLLNSYDKDSPLLVLRKANLDYEDSKKRKSTMSEMDNSAGKKVKSKSPTDHSSSTILDFPNPHNVRASEV